MFVFFFFFFFFFACGRDALKVKRNLKGISGDPIVRGLRPSPSDRPAALSNNSELDAERNKINIDRELVFFGETKMAKTIVVRSIPISK